MKKYKILLIVLACLIAVCVIWNLVVPAKYKGNELSFADSWRVRTLLTIKTTDFIEYGCGYSESFSVKIGGLTYCLAEDDCATIYIPELDFYYEITEHNHQEIHKLLQEYK